MFGKSKNDVVMDDLAEEVIDVDAVEEEQPAPLTFKEAKALKRSRYEDKIAHNSNFKKSYIIRNKKTNQVVEVRAASPLHAANIIGWRARTVEVLETKDIESPSDEPETVGSSSAVEVEINEKP